MQKAVIWAFEHLIYLWTKILQKCSFFAVEGRFPLLRKEGLGVVDKQCCRKFFIVLLNSAVLPNFINHPQPLLSKAGGTFDNCKNVRSSRLKIRLKGKIFCWIFEDFCLRMVTAD